MTGCSAPGRKDGPASGGLEDRKGIGNSLGAEYRSKLRDFSPIVPDFFRDSSPNSTAGRSRPGCHAHVWGMEGPGLAESLGHAHEAVSMAPKSLAQHHLRFISWSRGGDQRGGLLLQDVDRDDLWPEELVASLETRGRIAGRRWSWSPLGDVGGDG